MPFQFGGQKSRTHLFHLVEAKNCQRLNRDSGGKGSSRSGDIPGDRVSSSSRSYKLPHICQVYKFMRAFLFIGQCSSERCRVQSIFARKSRATKSLFELNPTWLRVTRIQYDTNRHGHILLKFFPSSFRHSSCSVVQTDHMGRGRKKPPNELKWTIRSFAFWFLFLDCSAE